jgi:hypothetical protein
MEVEDVNVHECLDQPSNFAPPKACKKQMVHKETPRSNRCSTWALRKKKENQISPPSGH